MPSIVAIVDCPLDCPQEEGENNISTCHIMLQLLTVAMQAIVDYCGRLFPTDSSKTV